MVKDGSDRKRAEEEFFDERKGSRVSASDKKKRRKENGALDDVDVVLCVKKERLLVLTVETLVRDENAIRACAGDGWV